MLLATGLAIFTLVESVLPRRQEAGSRLPEPLWIYTVGQGLFLALLLLVQWGPLPPIASAVLVLLVPASLVLSFAFLLRVIFPKPSGDSTVSVSAREVRAETPEPPRPEHDPERDADPFDSL